MDMIAPRHCLPGGLEGLDEPDHVSPVWPFLIGGDAGDDGVTLAFCPVAMAVCQHDLHICYLAIVFEPLVGCCHIGPTTTVYFEFLPVTTAIDAVSLEVVVPLQDACLGPAGDSVDFCEELAKLFLADASARIDDHVDRGCCVVADSFHAEGVVSAVASGEGGSAVADVLAKVSA